MNFSGISGILAAGRGRIPLLFVSVFTFFLGGMLYWTYTEFSLHRASAEARVDQNLRDHLTRIEEAAELDLSRMVPYAKVILRPKVLNFFLSNSALETLFTVNSGFFEHYFYTNTTQRLYSRACVSDWKEIPEAARELLIKRPEEFKIFVYGEKIYFGKGRRISAQSSFHFLVGQPLEDFCKIYGIERDKLVIGKELVIGDDPVFISRSALIIAAQNALKKKSVPSYFSERRDALSLWTFVFLLVVVLGIFSFRKIVARLRSGFDKRLRSEVEFLTENYADIHQDVQSAQEEIQILKHNVFLNRISDEARLKVLEKIFPSYPTMMSHIQMLQAGMITGRLQEKMENIVLGFKESIESLGTKNREVTVSLSAIIEEIREIFLGEFSKNKILFEVEGTDGTIGGPISNMYFIFYFLFKKIAMDLPPQGYLRISLHGDGAPPYVVISDNGLSLSPTEKERLTNLVNSNNDLVKDPTEEEFQQALDYLGWTRDVTRTGDNKTVTTVRFASSSHKNKEAPREEKSSQTGASNIVCITTKKPL